MTGVPPSIPPGMDPAGWAAMARQVEREVAGILAGGPVAGDERVTARLVQLMETRGLARREALAAARATGLNVDRMRESLDELVEALPDEASAAVSDLLGTMADAGMAPIVNRGALEATIERTRQAITHDWQRLAASTQDRIVEALRGAMVAGDNPRAAARRVFTQTELTYSRGLNIARTEVADMYGYSRQQTLAANDVPSWWWRARPDACVICQTLHGEEFPSDQPRRNHHQCRCVMVPLIPGWTRAQPKRDAETILGNAVPKPPKSWPDGLSRDDLLAAIRERENGGWRRSYAMGRPAPGSTFDGFGRRRPPPWQPGRRAAPLDRPPLVRDPLPTLREAYGSAAYPPERIAQELDRHRFNVEAYERMLATDTEYLAVYRAEMERDLARLRAAGVKPQQFRNDWSYASSRDAVKGTQERIRDTRRRMAEARAEIEALETHGLTVYQVEWARQVLDDLDRKRTFTDGLGKIVWDRDASLAIHPNLDPDDLAAEMHARLYEALNLLPENVRDYVTRNGYELYGVSEPELGAYTFLGLAHVDRPRIWTSLQNLSNRGERNPYRGKTALGELTNIEELPWPVSSLLHEIGHTLDPLDHDNDGGLFARALQAAGGDSELLSKYGQTKGGEMVAETFVRWVRGDVDPLVQMVAEVQKWASL